MLYLNDHDDTVFPAAATGVRSDGLGSKYGSACFGPGPTAMCRFGYPLLVQEYAKNTDIFMCPNDKAEDPLLGSRFDTNGPIYWYVYGHYPSYGLNVDYLNRTYMGPMGPEKQGVSASTIGAHSTTVLFAEATANDYSSPGRPVIKNPVGYYQVIPPSGGHTSAGTVNTAYAWSNFPTPGDARGQGQLWGRFGSKQVIVGWMDGHAKVTPIDKLRSKGTTPEELDVYFNGMDVN